MTVKTMDKRIPERERLAAFIEEARQLSAYPGIDWEAPVWEVTEYERVRAHKKRRLTLRFIRRKPSRSRREPERPLPQPFGDLCKALVRHRVSARQQVWNDQQRLIDALRFLYESLEATTGQSDPTRLVRKHFALAEEAIRRELLASTAYRVAAKLEEVSNWLDEYRLTPLRINYQNLIKRPLQGDRLDPEGQKKGMEKMPSKHALEALGEISARPLDDNERVRLRIIDLLVAGGFRIGEALTLPADCWLAQPVFDEQGKPAIEPETGQPLIRYGIRYWPEKGGEPIPKWLPTRVVSLARRAVEDLQRLGAEAREYAATLEADPQRVPLPGSDPHEELITSKALGEAIGIHYPANAAAFLRRLDVRPVQEVRKLPRGGSSAALYRVANIERALVAERGKLEVLHRAGGKRQTLSQSLCVIFRNQFHSRKATLFCFPELVNEQHISDALGGRTRVQESVFSRRHLTEPEGSPLRINTHAFRHWLNTLADHGGLSDLELARWMGRKDLRQNEAYKHGTVAQRVEWAQEMIRAGRLKGELADTYEGLDPVSREAFLEAHVSVVHFTPFGICSHDFAIEPCAYHLNCLRGCPEYLRTQGDPSERQELLRLREMTLEQIRFVEKPAEHITADTNAFLHHNRKLLEGIEVALTVDEEGQDARMVKVFPNGKRPGEDLT